ncbi:G patch domain-containing protein 2-like isoform X3 [Xiphias gladius]|uniref:G patch domain-containing protein 2-like isoform X3 n=1 Tax=Xiphias gladius TaxID=8245 RepID=UPI001A999294|nr:G patch domain-containing protein 2-like isoform X3 [Xiphias gladius]
MSDFYINCPSWKQKTQICSSRRNHHGWVQWPETIELGNMDQSTMMDELVKDLVSALEQTSEQSKLGELWEEMVFSPLQQRRQIRRRRVRKRCRESSVYPTEHRRCWIEASESSLDEAKKYRENSSSTITASVANCSDSDDLTSTNQWPTVMRGPARMRQPSWPESDSFTENNPGRPLRRRRKVKRMTSGITVRLQKKLNASGVDGKRRYRPSRLQQLSGSKKRSGGWMGADRQTEGARLMGKECWKRKMAKEHRDGADENMSEGETSSTCSSDPGLFTNDEGRQGDDEQSDWFFEGDCGAGTGVASLLPNWDSDNQLSLEGYHSRLKQLPGSAACCIRKGRRKIPSKGHSMPVFVERLRHFSQDPYQRDFWLPSVGKRDRSQLNPLCPLPVCAIDMVSESSHLRCSSSICRNSPRQTNITTGLPCTADVRRRRETEAGTTTTSVPHEGAHVETSPSVSPAASPLPSVFMCLLARARWLRDRSPASEARRVPARRSGPLSLMPRLVRGLYGSTRQITLPLSHHFC